MRLPVRSFSLPLLFAACWLFVATDSSSAQRRTGTAGPAYEQALAENALAEEQLQELVGQMGVIRLSSGELLEEATIEGFSQGREKDRFKLISLKVAGESRTRRFPGSKIFNMQLGDREYRVTLIPSQRAFAVIDMQARNAEIEARLETQRHRVWDEIDDEQQQKYVEEYKEFLKNVDEHFSRLNMKLYETKYFLFFTDMPANQVTPYIRNLDTMNEKLGEAFGFEPGENIWRGKAVVVAFLNKESFVEFEREFMNYAAVGDAQGLCHSSSDGKVIVSCYRGDNPSFFAAVLVHETAHGYVHRFKSTAYIPAWLNEGIADWIAGLAVPANSEVRRRQEEAALRLRQTGSLGGLFQLDRLDRWQYGAASAIVNLLVRAGSDQFRLFFNGIKEGLSWEDALTRAYGMSVEDLARVYGRSIGLPQIRP